MKAINQDCLIFTKKKLLLFICLLVPACLLLYVLIIVSGVGIQGGSVLALALMWMPGLAALVAKLVFDHSVCGIGLRVHKTSLPELATAYLIPLGLYLIVYGLAWFSVLTGFLCLRGHSLWPAVLLHASHNVFVQSVFDPLTRNGPYTQYLTSEFGLGLALGYLAIACFLYRHSRQEFFRQ